MFLNINICFAGEANVKVIDGEDWSLPAWANKWSPYGGIYMLWYGRQIPIDNPNIDISHGTKSINWKDVHIGPNQFDWSKIDEQIAQVDNAGKKFIFWYSGGKRGRQ